MAGTTTRATCAVPKPYRPRRVGSIVMYGVPGTEVFLGVLGASGCFRVPPLQGLFVLGAGSQGGASLCPGLICLGPVGAAGPSANTSYRSAEFGRSRWSLTSCQEYELSRICHAGRQGRLPIRATARLSLVAPVGR
jgi:hypothetical protein